MIDFDLDDATQIVARTPPTLRAWLAGLPEPWLRSPEVDGAWSPHDRTTDEALGGLARLRAANLDALRALEIGPARYDDPGLHPDLGPVTLRQLLATWTTHDLTHIAPIGRILAKQTGHEVGPWRAYLPLPDRDTGGSGGS